MLTDEELDELDDIGLAIRRRRQKGESDKIIRTRLGRVYSDEQLSAAFAEVDRLAQRAWWPSSRVDGGGALIDQHVRGDEWYCGPVPHDDNSRWAVIKRSLDRRFASDPAVVASVDETSTHIVGLLANPHSRSFARRGLVLGYVQSGKTTSFTAVAAKAADAGYRLIIVLAGMTDNLRVQTQERLDFDLTNGGDPTATARWSRLTSPGRVLKRADGTERRLTGDFPKVPTTPVGQALANPNVAAYAVLKKNSAPLRNLYRYLTENPSLTKNTPILVIDDEADQASIDTTKPENVERRSAVNRWILKLLSLGRVSYLGYTATPFANFFVDPRFQEDEETYDLYPRDFIYALPDPGSGYFGTRRLFGTVFDPEQDAESADDGADVIRRVPDPEALQMRKAADGIRTAPSALKEAIRYFLMATAARWARGQTSSHSTMLVHSSMRTEIHKALCIPVRRELDDLGAALSSRSAAELNQLRRIWDEERGRYRVDENLPVESFDELRPFLDQVVKKAQVVEENSSSASRLAYSDDEGDVVIVVGGNTLSRGLTLEGLVVSYFVRPSSTYDTLLQMGRWFGYRPGYGDLPRVWMTDELKQNFRHLAGVELELRNEISGYQKDPEMTPLTMGPRLRGHPRLLVTARAKMQRAVRAQSDFGGRVHQTTHFDLTASEMLERTWSRTTEFVATTALGAGDVVALPKGGSDPSTHVFHDVPRHLVLSYLEDYPFHPDESWAQAGLDSYLREESENGLQWNVALVGSTMATFEPVELGGITIRPWTRSRFASDPSVADIGVLRNSPRDEVIDITLDPFADVGTAHDRAALRASDPRFARHALLAIYPISKDSKHSAGGRQSTRHQRVDLGSPVDLLGVMLVFPRSRVPHPGSLWTIDPTLLAEAETVDLPPEDAEDDDV